MNTIFSIFFRAILFYLAFTLPAIFTPLMYFYSAFFAVCVSWVAGLIFAIGVLIMRQSHFSASVKYYTLYIFILFGIWAAFECIELFKLWDHIWRENGFLLFPLAALVAAWVSLFVTQNEMIHYLKNEDHVIEIFDNTTV
jgi:hypothetical protein